MKQFNINKAYPAIMRMCEFKLPIKKARQIYRISGQLREHFEFAVGFDFHVTKTGKVIMQIDPKNVKDRRKNIYRCAQLVHKGEMTREKADEMFRAWLNHASKGDNPKMIKKMHEYYQQCMEG